ncbi:MAG TPA: hypothetical protein VGZ47_02825 [Gemmataceae bacterium]|nr:hypothetical protein [Gemmataceae bacterium]
MRKSMRIVLPLLGLAALMLILANSSAQDVQPGKGAPKIKGDLPNKDMPNGDPANQQWPTQMDGLSLDEWIKRLDSKDPSTRNAAVRVVPLFGPPAKKAIDKLINLMGDPDNSVKLGALAACTTHPGIDEDPALLRKAVGKIRTLLIHPDEAIRFQAAMACNRIGPAAKECIPELCSERVLAYPSSYEVRVAGAVALGQIAYDDKNGPNVQAVSALAHRLSDEALAVRLEVVQALMVIGAPKDLTGGAGKQLMQTLIDRAKYEKDDVLKMWIRVCLMRFDVSQVNQDNIRAIAAYLKSSNEHLQVSAAKALGCIGPAAKSTIPDLIECLQKAGEKKTLYTIVMCIFALGQMGTDAANALPEIQKYSNDENEIIRNQVRSSMERINAVKVNNKK